MEWTGVTSSEPGTDNFKKLLLPGGPPLLSTGPGPSAGFCILAV